MHEQFGALLAGSWLFHRQLGVAAPMRPMTSHTPRPSRHGLAPALIAAAVTSLAACHGDPAPSAPPPPAVTVAPAKRATVTPWSEFPGQFASVQTVEVRPRVSGYIARVAFQEGAEVRAGDPLFVIDARPYAATLAGAQAQLSRAQAAVQLARSEAARADTLVAARAMAREDQETRASALAQALADERSAQAAIDTATLDVDWTVVRAPITGRVSRAAVTAGNYVQSGASLNPLTTIVSQDPLYVYFNADEQSYLALVRGGASGVHATASGAAVAIGLADEPGFPHAARIDFVDNQLDGTTGTIRVRAVVNNPDHRLTPGLYARVRLAAGAPYEATLIEDRAVGTDQDRRYVYVLKPDSTVDYRPVQVGPLDQGLRVVTSGVQPGDRIVVDGLQRLRPGAKVVAQLEAPAPDSGSSRVVSTLGATIAGAHPSRAK
jgi:multidrug efflux system membrane fusion protein